MTFFRSMLLLCPAAFMLAQTPPRPAPANATPVPKAIVPAVPGPPKAPAEVSPDTVVLTVGDTKMTARQMDQIVDTLPEQSRPMYRSGPGRKQLGDNMVKVLVLAEEAKKKGMDQTPAFKTQAMFQMANVLAGLFYADMNAHVTVDDAMVRKYYEDRKGEFEEAHARHILIRMKGSPVPLKAGAKDLSDEEALAKAQDIEKQLQAGGDFAALAAKESDDANSAQSGGDLPSFHHGQMVPSFEQAAFALDPGKISDPVKSQFGYHIIKLESKSTKSFEDAKPEIMKKLKPEQVQKAMDDLQKRTNVVLDPAYFGTAKQ
ncbi:MAG: peptidylprolyl isomerase [Candidatus Sulfopaludibacter sp.]|nr:peptidylprolyl isomerase [Candidatus Sulfopaludibacter sp.]